MAAITLGLLHGGTGPGWEPERVRLQVCDPAAIPERYLGIRIIGGGNSGDSLLNLLSPVTGEISKLSPELGN